MSVARVFLGLGANLGDAPAMLQAALSRLDAREGLTLVRSSEIIQTKAWGKTDQPDFHNLVAEFETTLSPRKVLDACLAIEADLGRVRIEKWGPRVIDIDVIAYDRVVMITDALTIPHPYAAERDFVLDPLREISPETADWIVSEAGKA